MISKSSYEYQMEIDSKERVVVGVNDFVSDVENAPDIQKIDKKAVNKQIERLKKFKAQRDEQIIDKATKNLKDSIDNNKNIMPSIINCVEANMTLGEISNLLRNEFGEYQG